MIRAVVYHPIGHRRATHIAHAMLRGLQRCGVPATLRNVFAGVEGELAIAYGWGQHSQLFGAYLKAGAHFLYADLGFWNRKPAGAVLEGYHKVSLDHWSPVKRMRRGCDETRIRVHAIEPLPYRAGQAIVVAGMSARSAEAHGFRHEQWERSAIARLKGRGRPIVYRPKHSCDHKQPLPFASYSPESETIEQLLARSHFLVTHHSNCAVDAAIAGVACYAENGAGTLFSALSMGEVERPQTPSDRDRWQALCDLAFCQWTPEEMRSGACFDHFRGIL